MQRVVQSKLRLDYVYIWIITVYCRHCTKNFATRSRGLCASCFADQRLRALYKPKTTNRRDRRHRVPPAPESTDAPPGSLAKVAVLERRAALRVELFHPDDVSAKTNKPPD